ncbi:hydantoin racemase [Colletotrichum plurivorum]|uniref:Hydantoin racemase n=1 Tax=Colletotrichum plurivorum TaxID=2175906 RepID=A0A8H6KA37_9PEZI|nr:hydantoin racemase [Colletotrichum plurivorum]
MTTRLLRRNIKILVINPNSSQDMTRGMERAIQGMPLHDSLEIHTYTAPAPSPASINDDNDIGLSTDVVVKDIFAKGRPDYDGVLVACYSVHNLVDAFTMWDDPDRSRAQEAAVTGIFEASILASMSLLRQSSARFPVNKWGIVTTGKFWEEHLADGVRHYLGQAEGAGDSAKFAGVVSTGLDAGDFHHVSPSEVKAKLEEATEKLLSKGDVGCVVMGCAGMAGLEEIIRATAVLLYGEELGNRVFIVDGVKAGIMQLEQTIRSRRLFRS